VTQAVVDELELVEVEEEDRDRGAAAGRHREGVLEAIEEEVAIRQSGERVVQGLVLGPLLCAPPLDRVGEDVGDRLHEVNVPLGEVAGAARAGADHAEGVVFALDQDDRRAPHALALLEFGLLEAGLGAPVVHGNGSAGRQRHADLRTGPGHDLLSDHLLWQAFGGNEEQPVLVGQQLHHAPVVDAEDRGEDPPALPAELVDVGSFKSKLAEAGDLALLAGLQQARLLAALAGGCRLGQYRAPLGLVARFPDAHHRDAAHREQAEAAEREAAAHCEPDDEERRQPRDGDGGDGPPRI
jgi:hypothetical protein